MKSNTWNDIFKPIVVLLVICLVSSFLLALVDSFTADTIAANTEKSNNEIYRKVLPEADSFEALECEIDGVTAVLKAKNGAGYVITAQSKGYGGQVPAAIGFDNDGNILRVVMMANDETPGLGQKVTDEAFYGQFTGIPAEKLTINDIDAVTGATISSKATVAAINLAIDAYNQICGGAA